MEAFEFNTKQFDLNVKQMERWPTSGTLLFVGSEQHHAVPYHFAKKIICQNDSNNSVNDSGNNDFGNVEAIGNIEAIGSSDIFDAVALWEAGSHPDFKVIQPEDNSRNIKIDQIRALNEWAQEKPRIARKKLAIFHPADALNLQAANALLKTLEEPTPSTLFILITTHPQRLLSTLRSRCHIIRYSTDDHLLASSQEKQQQHEPQQQQQQKQQHHAFNQELYQEVATGFSTLEQGTILPLKLAETWNKKDVTRVLYWMVVYLNETLKKSLMQGQGVGGGVAAIGASDISLGMVQNKAWWSFYDDVMQAKRSLDEKLPVNTLLLLERLIIQYQKNVYGS